MGAWWALSTFPRADSVGSIFPFSSNTFLVQSLKLFLHEKINAKIELDGKTFFKFEILLCKILKRKINSEIREQLKDENVGFYEW